jgi:hypothetical protein
MGACPSVAGAVFAARYGDKGGNANLGAWAKTGEAFAFLRQFLTTEKPDVSSPRFRM